MKICNEKSFGMKIVVENFLEPNECYTDIHLDDHSFQWWNSEPDSDKRSKVIKKWPQPLNSGIDINRFAFLVFCGIY